MAIFNLAYRITVSAYSIAEAEALEEAIYISKRRDVEFEELEQAYWKRKLGPLQMPTVAQQASFT